MLPEESILSDELMLPDESIMDGVTWRVIVTLHAINVNWRAIECSYLTSQQ